MIQYAAGLDVGGTSGRVLITDMNGSRISEYYGAGCSINTAGREQSESVYRELVLAALTECGLEPEGCRGICIAASGVDSPELEQLCRDIFLNMGFAGEVIIVQNDCEIFLNLQEKPSLVLVAGTGSICCGKTAGHEVVRSGGWNHILSDEGSAFRMGLEVIRHAGNHLDGQESCPVLYQGIMEKTGISRLYDLDRFVNENLMDKGAIGDFAVLSERSYRAGEAAGIAIIEQTAADLAGLVRTTGKKAGFGPDTGFCLWLWGSVLLKCHPLRTRVEAILADVYDHIVIDVPSRTALELAADIALKHGKDKER